MTASADRARAYRIFSEALERETDRRQEFLQQECGGDAALQAEVQALLNAAGRDDATGALLFPTPCQENLTGRTFGRFRLVEWIGEGGMGVVYRADRIDGVQQSVAIKLISSTVAGASRTRFEREAQVLAGLEHAAVARLIDAGVENERAWIAMEFVRGTRIDEYCADQKLSLGDIVGLIVQLADAISAAHRMLVVHSDIKPANVLVTADRVPKLIDFGISTVLRQAGAEPAATVNAARLFSPGFAAPEQVSGGPVTVATDVYGLGALAYRLLAGTRTFPDAIEPLAYMLAISQRDVEAPSRAALKAGQSAHRARALRGDLDAILYKALERDPVRRYASAADMQADFKRYLTQRPVRARTPSMLYRSAKFVRRHAAAVAIAGLLLVSLVVGGIVMELQARSESRARNMAAQRGQFLESLLKSADPRGGRRDVSVAELLDSAAAELDRKLSNEPLVEASMLGFIAQTNSGLGRYAEGIAANDRQINILRTQGGSALDIGQALSLRGELLREEGKWSDAEPVLREAVALLRQQRESADYCGALYLLGVVHAHFNQEQDAEQTFRETIAIESHGDPELQKQRTYPYHALAVTLADLGRYGEAVVYARYAVDLARRTLRPDHPDLLAFETTYAGALANIHQGAEAEPLFRHVIAAERRVLGATHKDTLLAQLLLADDLIDLHRDAEARELALSTARLLEPLLGADNMYTLTAWQEYGTAACNDHEEQAGLEALRRVETTRRRVLPAGSWVIYRAELGIGVCLYRAHRYAEAEPALLDAVAGLEAARGPKHRRTQEAYGDLHDLYAAMGRSDEAARWSGKLITRE
jgi:tetratricopeptide (TPR) repeat protein